MPHSFLIKAFDASYTKIPPTRHAKLTNILSELKRQLRAAPALLSCRPTGLLDVLQYPCNAKGIPIPVKDLPAYNQTHALVDQIYCFCGVSKGTAKTVRIFTCRSTHSEHVGCVCLGCVDWKPNGAGGCKYFVNLERTFGSSISNAEKPLLKQYPLRTSNPSVVAPTPVRLSPSPAASPPLASVTPPPRALRPLSPLGLTPGFLCDADRLYTPPPDGKATISVQDRTAWPDIVEAENTILSLIDPTNPGIGLPAPLPSTEAGSSGSGSDPMDEPSVPATPVKIENDDTDEPVPRKSRRRALIPAGSQEQDEWLQEHYDELEALQPGLARAIANGTPRNISGVLLVDGHNKLYVGSPSKPRPPKRKLSEAFSGSEDDEEDSSVRDSSDEDDNPPVRKKGKGVKRARMLGWGSASGSGGTADCMGDSSSAMGSGEATVKEEDVGGEGCSAVVREEPFTTRDGKHVMRIDLTDD